MAPVTAKRLSRESMMKASLRRSTASKRTPLSTGKRKFIKHSVRVRQARTMTGRSHATTESDLRTVPEGGLMSCFLKESLEQENLMNPSKPFTLFYKALFSMVQSQALLMHNRNKVVDVIIEHLDRSANIDTTLPKPIQAQEVFGVPSILNLVQVLCRDLKSDHLYPRLDELVQACLRRIDVNDVELTTLCFSTIGRLLERCTSSVIEADSKLELQTKLYPDLLGHSSILVRNLAAETFSYLVRQLPPVERKRHVWSLLKAPSEVYGDGISTLLCYVVRGVQGRFHSNMSKIISSAFRVVERNAKESADLGNARANVSAWIEKMRKYSNGSDDTKVFVVLTTVVEESETYSGKVFGLQVLKPWVVYYKCAESVETSVVQLIWCIDNILKESDDDNIEESALDFAINLWMLILKQTDEESSLLHKLGSVISAYLTKSKHVELLNRTFHKCLEETDFLAQFVPYILPHLGDETDIKVWTQVSQRSQVVFKSDPSSWARVITSDMDSRAIFEPSNGSISVKFVLSSLASLLKRSAKSAAEVIRLFSELSGIDDEQGFDGNNAIGSELERLLSSETSLNGELFGLALKAAAVHSRTGSHLRALAQKALLARLEREDAGHLTKEALGAMVQLDLDRLPKASLDVVLDKVADVVTSDDVFVRRSSLAFLSSILSSSEVVKTIRSMHDLDATFDSDRHRKILADALTHQMAKKLSKIETKVVLNGILGLYQVRFQLAWPLASTLLDVLCRHDGGDSLMKLGLLKFFKTYANFRPSVLGRTYTSPIQVFTSLLEAVKDNQSLLKLFRRSSTMWVDCFLNFMRNEFYATRSPDDLLLVEVPTNERWRFATVDKDDGDNGEDVQHVSIEEEGSNSEAITPIEAKKKLVNWLGLFSAMTAINQDIYHLRDLEMIWQRMLISEDCSALCTQCLINVHKKELAGSGEVLLRLAECKADGFKDILVDLSETIEKHREEPLFITVSSRLLFGKVTQRQGRKDRFSLTQRRTAVFAAFAALADSKIDYTLRPLFQLMLRPFANVAGSDEPVLDSHHAACEGFLSLLHDAIRVLGKRMMPFVDQILAALCVLIKESCFVDPTTEERTETETAKRGSVRARVRTQALERLTECVAQFSPEFDFEPYFKSVLGNAVDILSRFPVGREEPPSALLKFLCVCTSTSLATRFNLIKYGGDAFSKLLNRIEFAIHPVSIDLVFSSLRAVFEQGDDESLAPFLPLLLDSFSKRESLGGAKELEILSLISRELIPKVLESAKKDKTRIEQVCDLSAQLVKLLSSHVVHKSKRRGGDINPDDDPRRFTLEAVLALSQPLPIDQRQQLGEVIQEYIRILGPWSGGHEVTAMSTRQCLVSIVCILNCSTDPKIHQIRTKENKLLEALNKSVQTRVDREPDFDSRLSAYHELVSLVKDRKLVLSTLAIPTQALFDMAHVDFALRTAAQTFMMTWVQQLLPSDVSPMVADLLSTSTNTALKVQKDVSVRGGFLVLLKSIVVMAKTLDGEVRAILGADLAQLADENDPEMDFFTNASHVQHTRRGRTLARLASRLDSGELVLSPESLKLYVVPIALHGVFFENASVSETDTGLTLIASCARVMKDFVAFDQLLFTVLKRLSKATTRVQTRVLLRCACTVLDSFPLAEDHDAMARLKSKYLAKFERLLVMPKTDLADEEFSESVALSLVRLCRGEDDRIDNLILVTCGQLRRRKQSARDTARNALRKISRQLGVDFLPRILQHLSATLVGGGYLVHVLSYTIYILIQGLKEDLASFRSRTRDHHPSGEASGADFEEEMMFLDPEHDELSFRQSALDQVVDTIMVSLEEELFNENASTEANGYKSKLKLREQRASKAGDTLEALASCIAFLPCDSIHKLARPFVDRLSSRAAMLDPKVVNKCRDSFVRIRTGLMRNNTVRGKHLLVYVHTVLTSYVATRHAKDGKQGDKTNQAKRWLLNNSAGGGDAAENEILNNMKGAAYYDRQMYVPGVQLTGRSAERMKKANQAGAEGGENGASAEYLFVEFVLELVTGYFFRGRKQERLIEFRDMIGPVMDLLVKEIVLHEAASKRALVLSLRMFTKIVDANETSGLLNMDQVKALAHRALKFVRQNSQSASLVTTDVSRAGIDFIASLLSTLEYRDIFSSDDLKVLVRIARLDIDEPNRTQVALRLLKCVFDRKLLIPDMYDVALRLTHLIFQSSRSKEREQCADLVCQFLLDFPLEEKKVQEQIDLILKNLDFPLADGRLAGLKMLRVCLNKFPVALVDDSAEYYFLPLTLRLVNDDDPDVKEQCTKTIISLMNRVTTKKFQRLTSLVLSWFDKSPTRLLACNCASMLIETSKTLPKSAQNSLVDHVVQIIRSLLSGDGTNEEAWTLLYQAMVASETFVAKGVIPPSLGDLEPLLIPSLVHPHAWVRLVASRLFKGRLDAVQRSANIGAELKKTSFKGFDVLLALVDQLDSDSLSDDLCRLVTENLIKVIRISEDQENWFVPVDSTKQDTNPRVWLTKRLGVIASRPEKDNLELKNRRRRAVFTVYLDFLGGSKVASDLARPDASEAIVRAAITLHTADLNARDLDPLRTLADQVLEGLKKVVGDDVFVDILNQVRTAKEQRKQLKRKSHILAKVSTEELAFPKRSRDALV